jgi:hypothetical protein
MDGDDSQLHTRIGQGFGGNACNQSSVRVNDVRNAASKMFIWGSGGVLDEHAETS